MESKKVVIVAAVAVMAVGWLGVEGVRPQLHYVGGGDYTWRPTINFTDWSIDEVFYVGDWIYFGFDINSYSVLEVNKTSYESCNDKDFIFNVTKRGRDVFNLTEAKSYYFISGKGFCSLGMKVAVLVEDDPSTHPISVPTVSNFSPSTQLPLSLFLLTIAMTLIPYLLV